MQKQPKKDIEDNTEVIKASDGIEPPKAYQFMGIPFYSARVFYEFITFSLLIIIVPVVMVKLLGPYVETLAISNTMKTVYQAAPAILFINIVIGVYIYRVVKDPANYAVLRGQLIRIKKDK